MPVWLVYDPINRRITSVSRATSYAHIPFDDFGGNVLVDIEADPRTQRVTDDFTGVEDIPPLGAVISPNPADVGEEVMVTASVAVRVYVDGEFSGQLSIGGGTLEFEEAGEYHILLVPVNGEFNGESHTLTVT